MSTIGDRLKEARERMNLKQTQVMARIGINNKTLSGYEKGVSEPDLETLKILATLYEVNVDWLTGFSNKQNLKANKQELELSRLLEQSNEQLALYEKTLPPDKKERFEEKRKRLNDMIKLVFMEELEDNKKNKKNDTV